jgi:coenzyme F420-reducing hydrogenase delta subunit
VRQEKRGELRNNRDLQVRIFACHNVLADNMAAKSLQEIAETSGMQAERIPCLGRIDPRYLLKAFEAGCDAVCLIGCLVGKCKTMDGNLRAQKRVAFAGRILDEIGIQGHRVFLFLREPMNEEGIRKVLDEFQEAIGELEPTGLKQGEVTEQT